MARVAGAEWLRHDREDRRAGRGRGGSCRSLGPQGRLGLLPRMRREPWRAMGRGAFLTQGLTDALWWPLWGGRTVGTARQQEVEGRGSGVPRVEEIVLVPANGHGMGPQ